jgi:uncharacterized protein YdaU (DUF1376 family)
MSGEAVKAYMYLLSESWLQTPRATLPNNDNELASMARLSYDAWMGIKSEVLKAFAVGVCKEHKGLLYNEKLLECSRKSESNQRFNNENAKRTRKNAKRTRNAEEEEEDSISINSEFICFWKIYPKKKNKGDALKAWLKIKEPKIILEKIKIALSWQIKTKDWIKESGQYIPYPASYLNATGWEDSPMVEPKKQEPVFKGNPYYKETLGLE